MFFLDIRTWYSLLNSYLDCFSSLWPQTQHLKHFQGNIVTIKRLYTENISAKNEVLTVKIVCRRPPIGVKFVSVKYKWHHFGTNRAKKVLTCRSHRLQWFVCAMKLLWTSLTYKFPIQLSWNNAHFVTLFVCRILYYAPGINFKLSIKDSMFLLPWKSKHSEKMKSDNTPSLTFNRSINADSCHPSYADWGIPRWDLYLTIGYHRSSWGTTGNYSV